MKNKKKTAILYVSASLLLLIFLAISTVAYSFLSKPFTNTEEAYLYIYPGDDAEAVESKLNDIAHPSVPLSFSTLAKLARKENAIKTGRYKVTPDMNMLTLLRHVCNHTQEPLNVVLPSVRTIQDLAGRLGSKLLADSLSIVTLLEDSAYCASLGYTTQTIPALFIPNTYQIYWDTDARQLMERMKRENAIFWDDERTSKAQAMQMTPSEVATLASIVDSETANNPEKPRIAGLYLNRIAIGMPLQSDPTVIFATGDFSIRRVRGEHLKTESPYNTYKNFGLPPGPIRIPSIAGIDAVLNHETHNYIYMCAKEDFSGTHNYAATYREHQQNARRYVKALNERGIK